MGKSERERVRKGEMKKNRKERQWEIGRKRGSKGEEEKEAEGE